MSDQLLLNKLTGAAVESLALTLPPRVAGIRLAERNGYFEIVVQNAFRQDEPIRISTQGAEITWEFGQCHSHFDDYDNAQSEADLVEQLVTKVERIAGGSEASYSAWAGELCLGGGWLPVNGDGAEELNFFPQADRLKVVAWEPWHDREIRRGD